MSPKRILKELAGIQANPPAHATVELPPSQDIHTWRITLSGPPDTPYSAGKFALICQLPAEYPFKPPTIRFGTRIYHPNVADDRTGAVCLGMLKSEAWKPSTQMRAVIEAVVALLVTPQPDDPVEARIAQEFREQKGLWEDKARQATEMWATKGVLEWGGEVVEEAETVEV